MRRSATICLAWAVSAVVSADATTVGLRFSTSPTMPATIFGTTISTADTIEGVVVYDSASNSTAAGNSCGDCLAYPQTAPARMLVEVGPLTLRYASFEVVVINDSLGLPETPPEDVILFGPDALSPTPGLVVNGTPQATGSINVSLTSPTNPLAGPVLPSDPNQADYPISNVLVGDGTGFVFGLLTFGSLQRFEVLAGDFDFDEAVSLADYDEWSHQFGSSVTLSADGNGDGTVDAADYTVWRDAFAQPGSMVPEPSTAVATLLFSGTAITRRRRP